MKYINIEFENKDDYKILGHHKTDKVQGNLLPDDLKEIITQIYNDMNQEKLTGMGVKKNISNSQVYGSTNPINRLNMNSSFESSKFIINPNEEDSKIDEMLNNKYNKELEELQIESMKKNGVGKSQLALAMLKNYTQDLENEQDKINLKNGRFEKEEYFFKTQQGYVKEESINSHTIIQSGSGRGSDMIYKTGLLQLEVLNKLNVKWKNDLSIEEKISFLNITFKHISKMIEKEGLIDNSLVTTELIIIDLKSHNLIE